MGCDKKHVFIAGVVIGALLLILGGILIPVGDKIIQDTITKDGVIEEGTLAYENWIQTGSTVYRQFWLFNVLNPMDIIDSGAKPQLEQRGPYTYRVRYLRKNNITVNDNYTISYLQPQSAIFEPTMSVGSEEDSITALNLAAASAPSLYPPILHGIVNGIIKKAGASLFQNRTVKEILWGYEDPILVAASSEDIITGVFYPYNGTADGFYNVFNGKDDIDKVALIDRWRNEKNLPFWNDAYCDMINGTDGSSFPPFIDKKDLYFFSSDICRSIFAKYEGTQKLKGIPVQRFAVPPEALASPRENPDNHCFCKEDIVSQNCTLGGFLDISACHDGKPVYISLPHFLYASPEIQKSMQGLNPKKAIHETFMDVEPTTGFTLRVAKRLQINIMFKPSTKIKILSNIKEPLIFPVLWLNETATVDDETAQLFRDSLLVPVTALGIVQLTLICSGSLLVLVCAVGLCVTSEDERKGKPLHLM
ncbi:platelet glycoprotein 4 [Callorhinchus milii]|uniref:platelet glycoprotein 4 n=1 Tax=Callorhinchus milii TaxID=7868 RepID=UPI001C3FE1DD|nr:platelet glycoprotein 4 [Callorhinchus milii]